MTRPSRSGTVLKRIGVTLIAVSILFQLIMHILGWEERVPFVTQLVILFFVVFFTGSVGAFLFWRGRQYASKADAERILTDSNPDVLYLRAFRSI